VREISISAFKKRGEVRSRLPFSNWDRRAHLKAKRLRELLETPGIIRAPGVYDAWSARLVEAAGFPAAYMTGYGTSASVIGQPDLGFLTMTEMVNHARNIAGAINIPLIADADTGYGGPLNVVRTVREYEGAGVAALQLEDQVFPKRCGHMEGKQLIPVADMVAKIRAAIHARQSKDFIIISRTDARAVLGFDGAIERARAYDQAGADVVFIEAPESVEEMKKIGAILNKPLFANMVENGKTPFLTGKELEELGYKIVIYPLSALYAATSAVIGLLERLKEDDTTANFRDKMVDFKKFNDLVGLTRMQNLERSFSSDNVSEKSQGLC
jgi:carboxyvinyl-carboxyphosphonate phosphorylmutase